MGYKYNSFTGKLDIVNKKLTNPLQIKGTIATNTDFPLIADVKSGWFYWVTADVTDDAGATYTNTGQTFKDGDEIAWNGSAWLFLGNNSGYFKLDQTTPQEVINGIPVFIEGITINGDFVNQDLNSVDIGYSNLHDNRGYNATYITDKEIYNSKILGSVIEEEGSVKSIDGSFYIYLNGVWNEVVIGFRFREDDSEGYELEHKPIGFNNWYEVMTGNSNLIASNGLPFTQQYTTSMGALPVPLEIDGGTF